MPTITVRNVSADTYERLKERARRNRRSLTQEAAFLIEQGLSSSGGDQEAWGRADRVRDAIHRRYGSFADGAPSIAEDRGR